MKKFKKLTALALTATMALSMAACGSGSDGTTASGSGDTSAPSASTEGGATEASTSGSESKTPKHEGSEPRTIRIGTWYDIYYDSTHTDIHDDPSVSDEELAQMMFDNLKRVEEKYNVRIEYVNLTYDGIQESINTSVLAGKPDCDIYLTEPAFGIPAVANGYATDLSKVLPADADILTNQNYLTTININGFDGTYFMLPVGGESIPGSSYVLSFNKKMLDDAGLENPNALYERGEWTWEKWREYLMKLTKDSDGDGVTDVYGFGSRYDWLFEYLNMSNGTAVASNQTENLSSKEVGETLDFIYNMYNVDHVANPWNEDDWNYNQNAYQQPVYDYQNGNVNNYGAPDAGPTGAAKVFSIISLICGIISLITCCYSFFPGIPGLIFAIVAKAKFKGKNTMATLGMVFSIIGLALGIIWAIIFIAMGVLGGTSDLSNYRYY